MQEINFYCRKCKKSMKMTYFVTGESDTPVMAGMMIRCRTNKCTRVVTLRRITEGRIVAMTEASGKCYL